MSPRNKGDLMPVPSYDKDNSALLDSHEDRLQKLEEGTNEILTSLATNTQKTEHLSQRMNEGFAALSDKIETCVAPLNKRFEDHLEEADQVKGAFQGILDSVKVIEEDRKKRIARFDMMKKVFGALALASFGAFAKVIFEVIFHH